MMSTTERIEVKTLTAPKMPAKNLFGILFGGLFALLGVIFMITIILFIPGIFGVLIGFVVMVMSVPKVSTECRACGQPVSVKVNAKSGECPSCKTANPVVWEKAAKSAK